MHVVLDACVEVPALLPEVPEEDLEEHLVDEVGAYGVEGAFSIQLVDDIGTELVPVKGKVNGKEAYLW